jgi:hypothetical protein
MFVFVWLQAISLSRKIVEKSTGRPTLEHFQMNLARRFPATLLDKNDS